MAVIELEEGVKLRKCPFCGSEPVLKGGGGHFWVKCPNVKCGVSPAATTKSEAAVDAWNRRN